MPNRFRNPIGFNTRGFWLSCMAVVALALAACQPIQPPDEAPPSAATPPPAEEGALEIWGFDQADTREGGGGILYIWSGSELLGDNPAAIAPEIIDLGEAAEAAGCPVATRPHMGMTNRSQPATHVLIANVASGDTHFFDIESRTIVGCVNTVEGFDGAGGSISAHATMASPDNSFALVADMGPAGESGYLHKIQTNYATNEFELVETLALDVFTEDLETELARPICHEFTDDGRFAYVTMAQGGLLIIDVGSADGSTPMTLAHAHTGAMMPGAGCGVFHAGDGIILSNGESGAMGGDDFLYIHDANQVADGIFPAPVQIELPGEDTHGVAVCTDEEGHKYAISVMRVSNDIVVTDLETHEVVVAESMATEFSPNPGPDLAFLHAGKLFVSLRGGQPLTAINPLIDAQRTPGIAIIDVSSDCLSFNWEETGLLAMDANELLVDIDGVQVTSSDPHGLEVIQR